MRGIDHSDSAAGVVERGGQGLAEIDGQCPGFAQVGPDARGGPRQGAGDGTGRRRGRDLVVRCGGNSRFSDESPGNPLPRRSDAGRHRALPLTARMTAGVWDACGRRANRAGHARTSPGRGSNRFGDHLIMERRVQVNGRDRVRKKHRRFNALRARFRVLGGGLREEG